MRNFLIAIILLLQLLLGFFYYTDFQKCCNSNVSVLPPPDSVTTEQILKPLTFRWKDSTAITGPGWPAYKDSLMMLLGNEKKLEIKGVLYDPEGISSLSLARARSIRNLFPELPDSRISLQGIAQALSVDSTYNFEAAEFSITSPEAMVKVEASKTLIYFGSNSVEKLNSKEVEKYLDEIAVRVKQSGEKIMLIGHTDSVGPEESNMKLGLKRAETVKKYLIGKGVSSAAIMTESKGESQPVADNSSAEGRAQNRRTELTIIK